MKDRLSKYPLHTFVFPIYIILFLFIQNYQLLEFSMIWWSMMVSLICSSILWIVSYLVLKNKRKASVFSTFFLMALFTYGYFTDIAEGLFYKGMWPFLSVHRYLLTAYVIFFISLFLFIKKTKRTFSDFNLYLNAFCSVMILITLINFFVSNYNSKKELLGNFINTTEYKITSVNKTFKPDVYYIILDGYGRHDMLKKHYNFDNSYFTNFLKDRGFFVCDSSYSNYPATRLSLASSLNMNYIDSLSNNCKKSNDPQIAYIRQNAVSRIFKKMGYQVIHVKSGYSVTALNDFADITITPEGLNEFERSFFHLTILRLDEIFGFFLHHRITHQLEVINDTPLMESPKYTFIHIVCPHPPYIFKRDGTFKFRSRITNKQWWEPRNDYREQAEFVSDKIMVFIDNILNRSLKKPIIIIQSDHGPYIKTNNLKEVYDCRKAILNAYLVPDSMRKDIYHGISPVNSFRIIFNHLFETKLPLVRDLPPPENIFNTDAITKGYIGEPDITKNIGEQTH